jgi:hypothetical protein
MTSFSMWQMLMAASTTTAALGAADAAEIGLVSVAMLTKDPACAFELSGAGLR